MSDTLNNIPAEAASFRAPTQEALVPEPQIPPEPTTDEVAYSAAGAIGENKNRPPNGEGEESDEADISEAGRTDDSDGDGSGNDEPTENVNLPPKKELKTQTLDLAEPQTARASAELAIASLAQNGLKDANGKEIIAKAETSIAKVLGQAKAEKGQAREIYKLYALHLMSARPSVETFENPFAFDQNIKLDVGQDTGCTHIEITGKTSTDKKGQNCVTIRYRNSGGKVMPPVPVPTSMLVDLQLRYMSQSTELKAFAKQDMNIAKALALNEHQANVNYNGANPQESLAQLTSEFKDIKDIVGRQAETAVGHNGAIVAKASEVATTPQLAEELNEAIDIINSSEGVFSAKNEEGNVKLLQVIAKGGRQQISAEIAAHLQTNKAEIARLRALPQTPDTKNQLADAEAAQKKYDGLQNELLNFTTNAKDSNISKLLKKYYAHDLHPELEAKVASTLANLNAPNSNLAEVYAGLSSLGEHSEKLDLLQGLDPEKDRDLLDKFMSFMRSDKGIFTLQLILSVIRELASKR